MIASRLEHRLDLTPRELFAGFHFIQVKPVSDLPRECLPFACAKQPLEGTPYEFQLAVSDRSVSEMIRAIHEGQPELPLSGDRRSGVIVFNQGAVIGSLIIPGNLVTQGYKMQVLPAYRQAGLAHRMLVEWCWYTKRVRVLPKQGITLHSARALLSAHQAIVERAVAMGRAVPERVLSAVRLGEEAAQIIQDAERVEALVRPEKVAPTALRPWLGRPA